ncbi:MAG: class I SAM-dependent methyltransferase [bacterium]
MSEVKSLPERTKNKKIIEEGYNPEDFGTRYWMAPNRVGNRRIDRDAHSLRMYVQDLIRSGMLKDDPLVGDISCGPGNMVMDFRNNGFRAKGCEFSQAARALGRQHFGLEIPFGDLRGTIPFDSQEFDFVYCIGVMTMIPVKDVPNACRELHRVTIKGGLLHILLINPGQIGPRAANEPHLTTLPFSDWNQHFLDAGFTDVTDKSPPQEHGIGVSKEWDFAKLYQK